MGSVAASVVLLTYNQEQFVEEALLSLQNQDLDDLEVIVSDDCSSDATWEKIQKVASTYRGNKKLILSRNATNLGIIENFFAAVKKSCGELIFMAAGDDISLPNRCSKSIQFWADHGKRHDLVAADAFDISFDGKNLGIKENSRLQDWNVERWFEERPYFFGASHMMTRRLLEIGPLDRKLPYEDQCLVFRAMLMGGVVRLPIPLVCHRRGGMTQSINFQFGYRKAEIVRDMAREIKELQQFLNDASVLGKQSEVEGLIAQKLLYCQAILDLFKGPNFFYAIKKFYKNNFIQTTDKCRYLRYYFFFPLTALAHGLRDSVRMLKNKWRSQYD